MEEIIYNSQTIKVIEICREEFGFILFKAVNRGEYYLDIVRNHSFAYWSEIIEVSEEAANELIAEPTYYKAQVIFGNHK